MEYVVILEEGETSFGAYVPDLAAALLLEKHAAVQSVTG